MNHSKHRHFQSAACALAACLLMTLSLVSCQNSNQTSSHSGKLPVTASFSILADWVHAVGGDRIDLSSLVGPDNDSHAYEPSPRDSITLSKSILIFEIGLGFEHWMDGLFTSSGSKAKRIAIGSGLQLIHTEESEDEHDEEAGHEEEGHHHGEYDPHVWFSVSNALLAIAQIDSALSEADPEGTSYYHERAEKYKAELSDLDAWIKAQVQTIPESKRKLVTNHDTFGYLARDYGLEVLASAFEGISTEGAEPSAQRISSLITLLRESGVKVVFVENMASSKALVQAASEAGVRPAPALFTDALGLSDSPAPDYISLMKYDISCIVRELGQP